MKNNKIIRDISYGMYIVTTKDAGCVINTLCQITSGDKPVITISLNKNNYTNELVKKNRKFNVSILSENTNSDIIGTFGFKSSRDIDKFENCDYINEELPILKENTIGYIACEVLDIIDCDTHDIFVARVVDGDKFNDLTPMTYKYYHEVIKGKAPKNAPTFVDEDLEKKTSENNEEVWVCSVCGYVHYGPLPEDFRCPWCSQGADKFNRK